MAKQYNVILNTAHEGDNKVVSVQQGAGDRGQPVRIKAKPGAKYQLQEQGRNHQTAPEYVKVQRKGKDLHVIFENGAAADLIIEDYYEDGMDSKGLIGQSENGQYYNYIPEDPNPNGLVGNLVEGEPPVNVALGGSEVDVAGEIAGGAEIDPLVAGGLALLAVGGIAGGVAASQSSDSSKAAPVKVVPNKKNVSGGLDASSDTGVQGDNLTSDSTPTLSGKVPKGSKAFITIDGVDYPVTVDAKGHWTFTQPTDLPDGTYTPILHVTKNGVTKAISITPFTIDHTPPAIALTSDHATLGAGESATITFTLSEAVGDFTLDDIAVSGGKLTNLVQSATDPKVYTATFTADGSGRYSISVASDKFSDAAGNFNVDGGDANNTLSMGGSRAASVASGALASSSDTGMVGDNMTKESAPTISGAVTPGSTATVTINGQTYPVTVNPDGTYSFKMPQGLPDGTYTPMLHVTPAGSTTATDSPLTPFTVDTRLPSITVSADHSILTSGQTAVVTFTLSEVVSDFALDDVAVTGGTLSNFQRSATDPKVYTATFTPSSSATTASISVASNKFQDMAGNMNADGAEIDNTATFSVNVAGPTGALSPVAPNDSGVLGDNKTNDTTPTLVGTVPVGSTATVTINGQTYPVTVNPNGTYSFTQPTALPDGTYYPVLNVTTNGTTTHADVTPFTIDTTPPSITITSNTSALGAGQTATITFTLSESSSDLIWNGTAGDLTVTGGTLSALTQSPSNPLVYTATFTPTPSNTESVASISVASARFSDAAANFNSDGAEANNTVSFGINATTFGGLTPAAGNDSGVIGDNLTHDTTPTLNGKVPQGSTATVSINGQTYPVSVNSDGTYSFTQPTALPDGTYTPVLNVTTNGQTSSTPITPFTIDTVPPTIAVTTDTNTVLSGKAAAVTFTLSDVVSDFTAADVAVTGGALSNFQQSVMDPKVYTATFTPSSGATTATLSVASSKFSDVAGNLNADGSEANNTVTLNTNATVTGSLSSASDNTTGIPNDQKTNDPTPSLMGNIPAGSTATVTINGQTYPVTVKPDGSYSFTQPTALPDGTYTPVLNVTTNGQTSSTLITPFTIDTTPPTIAVSAAQIALAAGESTTITFTLSEVSTDFTAADLSVTGGTLGPIQQSASDPKVYTATFTAASGVSTGSVGVASNMFSDAAGNLNADGADANNHQTLTITSSANHSGTTATGALAPSSDSGVLGDNLTSDSTPTFEGTVPVGSTVTVTLNGQTYPVTINPDGSYSFTQPTGLPDGTYTPVLNVTTNGQTTQSSLTPFTIDTLPPSVFVQADKNQLLAGQTTTITFTLSETVTDFTSSDVTVTGGALSNFQRSATDLKVYTATFTPAANSTIPSVISVASGKFSDAANNFNVDGADVGATNTNTIQIPTNTNSNGGTAFLSPTSDTGIPGDNVTNDSTPTFNGTVPPGSTASLVINGVTYPVAVNPDGTYSYTAPANLPDGTYTPQLIITPAGSSTPNAPIPGTPFTIDTSPPTVAVSSSAASLQTGQTATITFTLSEATTDFTLADVAVTGGTLSNFQGSGTSYTATFTPNTSSNANGVISIASNKFSDAAGNFNADGSDSNNSTTITVNTTLADAVPPTIAVTADRASLAAGQTTLLTFTLSEASSDFTAGDVTLPAGSSLSQFAQSPTNPLVYTATFTPASNSTANSVISVASNKFSDAARNFNADGADANNTLSLPTNTTPGLVSGGLSPSSDTGVPNDNKTLDNTPTYSGTAPAGSTVDVVINGQHYQTVADQNGQYSVNVPSGLPDGTYTPQIVVTPAGSTTPNAPVNGTAFTIDTTAPTILVSSDHTSLTAGQVATITFTLSEVTTDFTLADVAVTGGTLSNFQGSGTSYTATFTPTTGVQGSATVSVASSKFSDAAGNFNVDGNDTGINNTNIVSMVTNTLPVDTNPPTIQLARTNPTASLKAGDTETITFTLSEASTSFNLGDIDVTGGTLSNFAAVPTSGTAATGYTQYTVTFTPIANLSSGTATVGVAAGKFSDNAGNANQDTYVSGTGYEANNQVSFTYNTTAPDTTPPTVALSRSATGTLAAGGSEVINIVLSEVSKDFDLTDVVVTGGTLSGFAPVTSSGSAATGYTDYVVTFTPTGNASGTATIGVDSLKFSDAAGNQNRDTYLSGATGYEVNNLVSIGYNTTVPDTTPPTIAITRSGLGTVTATETIYFTLSEASTNFDIADVDVTGGNLSNLVPVASSGTPATGYTQYEATFTPAASSSGVAAIGVASGTFTDAANNLNKDTYKLGVAGTVQEANNAVSFNYNTVLPDNTPPTVVVSRSGTGIVTATETLTFTLSEAARDFDVNDVVVTGGTLSGFAPVTTSGTASAGYTEYTAIFTPTTGSTGTATVGVAHSKFSDAAGNFNKDTFVANVAGTIQEINNSVSFNYNSVTPDTTAPTIVVSRLGSGTLTSHETIQFTVSEATKDFTLADIEVRDASGNLVTGALSNFAAVPTSGTAGTGYTTYVATFTPPANASGLATIGVAAGKFSDAAGNFNLDTYAATADSITGHTVQADNQTLISYNTTTPSIDTTTPTVVVSRGGSATLQSGNTETLTFTLSEPSLSFDPSDVTVSAGSLSGWTPVAASGSPSAGYTVYTALYTPAPNSNGTATIGVLSDTFSDAAGNLNKDTYAAGQTGTTYEANNQVSVAYNTMQADTTPPKVEVLRSGAGTITGPETIYFNFTEATTDFTLTDINVTGGSLSNLVAVTGSGNTQYTATFTPSAASTGTATIGVAAGKFSDASGNFNADTFDPSTVNYEANNLISATYNTTATPADITAPTVAISRAGTGLVTSSEILVFTFSEPVAGFALSDVVDTGTGLAATGLSNLTPVTGSGNTQYTATYTAPTASVGSVTFGIKAAAFTDTASAPNANKDTYEAGVANTVQEGNNQLTLAWDTDTSAPTITVSSNIANQATLGVGQTAIITFTLSEASADFTQGDVTVTGGALSNWQRVDDTHYTATFTPTPNNSGSALIGVRAGTFNDLGSNANADDYTLTGGANGNTENLNNKVDIAFNTLGATFLVNNDTATATEDGGVTNGNVKTNDSLVTTITSVSQGSTSGTLGSDLVGQYGTLRLNSDGSYTYTIDNTKSAVQSLKAGQTVSEVFSYTASGTENGQAKTGNANLVVTITGTNDAPVAGADVASATEAGGITNGTAGSNPTGNVLTNDTDVDSGDSLSVSGILAGTTGTATSVSSGTSSSNGTSVTGTHGTLVIGADGSYSYSIDQSDAAVQALLPSSTSLADTFTYTVKDASGATSTNTITVSIHGANDAPQVQIALADTTATTGSAFSYTFAGNANTVSDIFKDVDTGHQSALTYSASLADGSSLPSWLSFNASTRTFSGTPPLGTTPGNITVKVTATDSLGLSASDDFIIGLAAAPTGDTTPPTILIERANPLASLDAVGTETIIFTLSEASTTFDGGDITVSGGTLSNFTPVGSSGTAAGGYTKYTAVFTPIANSTGTATIGVASGQFTDNAANLNQDTYLSPAPTGAVTELAANNTNQVSLAFDTRSTNPVDSDNPTVQISIDKTTLSSGQSATLTFILSETSTDFTLADVDVISGGGSLSNLLPVAGSNGVQYTATYTAGSAAGDVIIGVDAGKFADATGNINNDTYKGNATGTSAVNNTTAEANNWVQLTNTGANDTTAPTVVVTRMGSGTVGSAGETMVFTLSEASTDFVMGDVSVMGGSLTNWAAVPGSNGTQYSATFIPLAGTNGTATIGVAAGSFRDAANNQNLDTFSAVADSVSGHLIEANNQVVLSYDARTNPAPTDTTAPTIAISASATTLAANQTATITFTLSEASTDFTNADVVVTGGTLSNIIGSGTSYTATFTPTAGSQGTGSIHVDSNTFRDAASNYNQDGQDANNTVNFITNNGVMPIDTTSPTIAITTNQSILSTGQTATITFTMSEATSEFAWNGTTGDVVVTGGTLGALTYVGLNAAGEDIYTAVFTPATNSTAPASIGVKAGMFKDAANNLNKDTFDSADTFSGKLVETNNQVTMTVNTSVVTALNLTNDTATAVEASGIVNATAGTNPNANVLDNDTGSSPTVTGVQWLSAGIVSAVNAGTTSTSGTTVPGQYGSLKMGADGTYVYTVDNANANVQALRTSSQTLTEVFTYTATDASGSKTATLAVTIQGANDAPTVVVQEPDKTATVGNAIAPFSILNNFADVDSTANGETATYSTSTLPTWLSFNAATGTFSGTPTAAGTTTVTVTRTDASGLMVTDSFDIVTALPVITTTASFSSMTKDSGTALNANWTTSDGSAGRLVSGDISAPLATGEVVKVYANGVEVGTAVVNGTKWEITDLNGYSANWTYTAQVVGAGGSQGPISADRVVTLSTADDAVAPTITSVLVDSFTTSNTTENFSSYTPGSTVGPNFTITARNGGVAGYGGSGATFNNVNDLLGGGMAIQFGNPQNQGAAAVGEILITKNTGDMYSLSFQYGDLQFGAKTVKLYAADGTVVNTFNIANGAGTFSSGIQSKAFTSIGISGGNQDFWIMDNFNFAEASATAGGQVGLAANSTFLDTTPVLQGTTGRALTAGESIHIFDGGTDLGAAAVTGTNWTFNTTLPAGSTKTYTASIVSASGQVLESSNGFTATQSASATLTPTTNLPTSTSETVAYTSGTLDVSSGDDIITAGSDVQARLTAGGFINGGTGLDRLKLTAGTTLNLNTLTNNQTVRSIDQVEIFEMQGSSSVLSMTANNVLSLGATNTGSVSAGNTSTMAPFSFSSTAQTAIGSVPATGSTSSANKVQMVIDGVSGDTLNLATLATDGVTTAGALGNAGLAGSWAYKGQVTINSTVYQVYDHSTTNAQVLVSVAVTVNRELPVTPALALTNDTAIAIEAGGTANGTAGSSATGSVLSNDQGASPTVTAIQLVSDATPTAVSAGTTSSTGTSIAGQYGTLVLGADGTYTYTVNNANATVQGLRTASDTLSEVFTYTANDGTGAKTANLVITVKGANDAPTLVVAEPDKTGLLVGTAISSFSIAGNFADVDSTANGETVTYSVSALPAGITFNAATGTFSGTPTAAGTTTVTVTRTDAAGLTATDTIDFVVGDVVTKTVAFSTMTKDSGTLMGDNANWLTADASAGRLVSGTISAALGANEVVEVYANGTKIGNAQVVGTAWELTDISGYNANWTYTAKVVNSLSNSSGIVATQVVTTDFNVDAPVITGVFDSSVPGTATVANNGSTTSPLVSVSGTASGHALIYLYDNTSTNLVGSAVADASGNWTVSGFGVLPTANTFSAKQVDVHGNESVLSNLWNVSTSASGGFNGNFDSGDTTGFATVMPLLTPGATSFNYVRQRFGFAILDEPIAYDTNGNPQRTLAPLTQSVSTTWNGVDTWSEKIYAPGVTIDETDSSYNTFLSLASGKIFYGSMDSYGGVGQLGTIWGSKVDVVKGQTYQFKFDYWNTIFGLNTESPSVTNRTFIHALIDGTEVMVTRNASTGSVTINYTATATGAIDLKLGAQGWMSSGDFALDNISFTQTMPPNGSLVPGSNPGYSDSANGSSLTPISFSGGSVNTMGGNDFIGVAAGVNLQSTLASGGSYINGGAGVDTLVLQAGSTLNLTALTNDQTVHPIQQVEVIKLQGTSNLTLSANDVLSLGGSNATTMAGYGSAPGKVQLVVEATGTDTVVLTPLALDTLTTNGVVGNTGLGGVWNDGGTTTIGTTSYHVYNHSTTNAQVLVSGGASVTPSSNVNAAQSVAITSISTSSAATALVEEFNSGTTYIAANLLNPASPPTYTTSTTINPAAAGLGARITTGVWDITSIDVWNSWQANQSYDPVNEMGLATGAGTSTTADNILGTDGELELGIGAAYTGNNARIYTFASKVGPFSSVSFKSIGYDASNGSGGWVYPTVVFYDADGNVVYRKTMTVMSSATTVDNFSATLPAGVTASSFGFQTYNASPWYIDELTMTPVTSSSVASAGTTADTTPLISGTYANTLNAGDVIKIYDGTTYLGDATVDPSTHTWTYQVGTAAAAGSHAYLAKIVNAGSTVSTSNSYAVKMVTPVVLDLNHDGVLDYSQVKMDLNADGILDTTAWVGAKDGILVRDVYGDGSVRSTSQFAFARSASETDLQGLAAQFDSNHDSLLDAKDAQFGEFAVWQDTNQNGVADVGEVKHLTDLGITSIQLNSDGVLRTPASGVTEAGHTTAQLANGSDMLVGDAAFSFDVGVALPVQNASPLLPEWLHVGTLNSDLPAISSVLPVIPTGDLPGIPDVLPAMPTGTLPAIPDVLPATSGMASSDGIQNGFGDVHSLFISGSGHELDLTHIEMASRLAGVENIDLGNMGANRIKLDLHSILNMPGPLSHLGALATADQQPMLVINGNSDDTLNLLDSANWSVASTHLSGQTLANDFGPGKHFVESDSYTQLTQNGMTLYVDEEMQKAHQTLTI